MLHRSNHYVTRFCVAVLCDRKPRSHGPTWKYLLPPLHPPVRLQLFQQLVADNLRHDVTWENKTSGQLLHEASQLALLATWQHVWKTSCKVHAEIEIALNQSKLRCEHRSYTCCRQWLLFWRCLCPLRGGCSNTHCLCRSSPAPHPAAWGCAAASRLCRSRRNRPVHKAGLWTESGGTPVSQHAKLFCLIGWLVFCRMSLRPCVCAHAHCFQWRCRPCSLWVRLPRCPGWSSSCWSRRSPHSRALSCWLGTLECRLSAVWCSRSERET